MISMLAWMSSSFTALSYKGSAVSSTALISSLVFCIAFGVILSISRMAQKKIREEEEAAKPLYESDKDDIQVTMDVLEQL